MSKKYDVSVYIGRMQPMHLGHLEIIKQALEISNDLIILLGSHNKPIDWENPWTSSERQSMMRDSFSAKMNERIHFGRIEDYLYQDKEWQANVYKVVTDIFDNIIGPSKNPKICLVGYNKDASSSYIHAFPFWDLVEPDKYYSIEENDKPLSATMVREALFSDSFGYMKSLIPEGVYNYIKDWKNTEIFKYVKDWYAQELEYAKIYQQFPYAVNFYCADSVVFQSGHVLLIKRKFHPGKNLYAVPGGHVNANETAQEASIRELREETGIKVPLKVLNGSLKDSHIFDHPDRSKRCRIGNKKGRTISHAFCYVLDDSQGLPTIKGQDDASEARWFTYAEVKNMKNQMFEDHHDIVSYFMGRV